MDGGVVMSDCTAHWELIEPNAEDKLANRRHECSRAAGHAGMHICVCGDTCMPLVTEQPPSDGLAQLPYLTGRELEVLLRALIAYESVIPHVWGAIDIAYERSTVRSLQTAVSEARQSARLDARRREEDDDAFRHDEIEEG